MLAAPYIAARRRMSGRGCHAVSPSRLLHGNNQDHMGEVLQKDLWDRQPETSVGHAAENVRAAVQGVECRARPFCAVFSGILKGVHGNETVFAQLPFDLRLREIELIKVLAGRRFPPACALE